MYKKIPRKARNVFRGIIDLFLSLNYITSKQEDQNLVLSTEKQNQKTYSINLKKSLVSLQFEAFYTQPKDGRLY